MQMNRSFKFQKLEEIDSQRTSRELIVDVRLLRLNYNSVNRVRSSRLSN